MAVLSELAKQPAMAAQRLRSFGSYVASHKGGSEVFLFNSGLDDWYDTVKFDRHLYNRCRILLGDKCGNVVRFSSMEEAAGYARSLLGVLKEKGYPHSKAVPEEVYVRSTVTTKWALGSKSQLRLSEGTVFLIRMEIKK